MKFYTLISIVLVICSSASAGIRPSFAPEESSWRATDIVVVTEEKQIDGVFKIIETWKGDLKPGETIRIPELAEFTSKDARLINEGWSEKDRRKPSEYVTGERMILFLRDAKKVPADADAVEDPESKTGDTGWKPANPWGREMKYSTVWIEKGSAFWFSQLMNPGPSLLYRSRIPETKLKTEVFSVLSTQTALNGALAIADPATRAASLEPFAHDAIFLARDQAFAALTECGVAALPVLRRMLDNELLTEVHGDVIEAFAKAGGKSVGPELTEWIEKELKFWKLTGPTLEVGWWNGNGFGPIQFEALKAVAPLHRRWSVLYHAVYALGAIKYTGAEDALTELSDFWRSLPQLYGDRVSEACDEVLRAFGSIRKEGKRPRLPKYEISFAGNKVFSSQLLEAKTAEYVAAYDRLEMEYEGYLGGGNIAYALHRVLQFMESQGYLNVELKTEDRTTERGALISVDINEGKQHRLGQIRIEGAKLFSAEQIRSMLTLREGDIADGEAIHKWLSEDLRKAYLAQGYMDYYASEDYQSRANSRRDESEVADYKIAIHEGPQYKVGSIKFEGKASIPDDRLNRAMLLRKGDIFSQKGLDESIDSLNHLGLSLDLDKDVSVSPDNAHDLVDIVIFFNKDRRPKESFKRSTMKRSWYP